VTTIVVLKLALAPVLILLATLAGRRWGPAVSGWLAGLPLTSAPVSLILALEQGPAFAARAALGSLFGLVSLALFALAYALAARRAAWPACVLAGLATFAGATAVFRDAAWPLPLAFALACGSLAAVGIAMAGPEPARAAPPLLPGDLAVRMGLAALLVLTLTSAARLLGPGLAGSLSPIPVFGALLAVFAQRDQGAAAAVLLLRGMVLGSFGFATFLLIVAALLDRAGLAATYALAAASALAVHGATLGLVRRRVGGAVGRHGGAR
jgi:hypothetical protein